ncbi:MAG: class I SAM-dependent methyltransferase [Planctomycetes bacterium]|nr:class I SAM-dependent methyltransferase [Planctomycetota bacterium]
MSTQILKAPKALSPSFISDEKPFKLEEARAQIESEPNHNWFSKRIRKTVIGHFHQLRNIRIQLIEGQHQHLLGQGANKRVELRVHNQRFFHKVAHGGCLGAAQSYIDGDWDCDSLFDLFTAFASDQNSIDSLEKGSHFMQKILSLQDFRHRNTLKGSKKNIAAHYDLGNDFFKLFLDPTLCYSSGIFPTSSSTLEEASLAKMDRICSELNLNAHDHIMEIGTGWGGFAIYAAAKYGCRVTTTTISKEQYDIAKSRIAAAGLEDRITLLLKDYRELDGEYNHIVSIEMIEAVGHQYYKEYFQKIDQLLKPGGKALIQAILIPDYRYDQHLKSLDFIQHSIFPGSTIPSLGALLKSSASRSKLTISDVFDMTEDYALTMRHWQNNFRRNIDKISNLGYPQSFLRMWTYYLDYCAAGFATRYNSVAQITFTSPAH